MDRTEMREFSVGDAEYVMVSIALCSRADPLSTLSLAERQIAGMVADGMSNSEIAAARGKSVRTIANQIASAFRKLNVGSRRELASALALFEVRR
jgi:DNA-binding CsgD family transcriptional regulator